MPFFLPLLLAPLYASLIRPLFAMSAPRVALSRHKKLESARPSAARWNVACRGALGWTGIGWSILVPQLLKLRCSSIYVWMAFAIDDERPASHIGCSGLSRITSHPFLLVREDDPNTDRTAAVSPGNVLKPSGQLSHTLDPPLNSHSRHGPKYARPPGFSAHAWQIRCSPDHPMLRPFTPHTHSFRPVRHAWRVITDPYDKMPMCDAARSLIGVLSPGSRHAPVDHGHTHTGLAISGQKVGDGHASIVCMAPIGTLTRAGTAKQLPAGRVTAPGVRGVLRRARLDGRKPAAGRIPPISCHSR